MFRLGKRRSVVLIAAFLLSGIAAAVWSNSYLAIMWRIKNCSFKAPLDRPMSMVGCRGASTQHYYSGALYLGIDRPLIEALAAADVVIMGNSRTQRSFATKAVDDYFRRKGLRYFIIASEGSGFRFTQMILERNKIAPKILLVSNESYFVDVLEDTNKDVVLDPDRFYPSLASFYQAKRAAELICRFEVPVLRGIYCGGKEEATWRGLNNGMLHLVEDYGEARQPIAIPPETRLHHRDFFLKHATQFVHSPSVRDSCLINYLVPSNNASVDLARAMADAMKVPFVFPEVRDYFTHDGSHMVPESSERWSAEFMRMADQHIDRCLGRMTREAASR